MIYKSQPKDLLTLHVIEKKWFGYLTCLVTCACERSIDLLLTLECEGQPYTQSFKMAHYRKKDSMMLT